jgi:Tfp pilus assembly protein PilF
MPAKDGCVVDVPVQGVASKSTRHSLAIAIGFLRAGHLAHAEQAFLRIAQLDPLSGQTRFFLGLIHQERGSTESAIEHYKQAIHLNPDLAEARNNLGVILQSLRRIDEAEACFREALELEPDYAQAHNNLGNALQDQGRFEEATTAYRRALHYRPGYVAALKHLGNALRALGRLQEAIACYDEGLRHAPEHVLLHMSRALVWLQMGNFEQGWPECEWRLSDPNLFIHRLHGPVWDGKELDGHTIVIVAEQGLGDTIQYIRYASIVARRGGRVVVTCARVLSKILATCPGVDQIVVEGDTLPDYSCNAPVMNLPAILGTTLQTIPAEIPYLAADPAYVARWRDELQGIKEFKIGVVWQGNPLHTKDRDRSFRLAHLQPVADLRGVRLYSLQKNFGLEQIEAVSDLFPVIDLGQHLHDFVDTAALMQNLDLVISADSSPAHLAGALGVRVWMPVPYISDWRWMTDREDTPWYPTMRLFRQRRFGDWEELFSRLAVELAEAQFFRSRGSTPCH